MSGDSQASCGGWAHKMDSGNLESIKLLSYRVSWAQVNGSEKKESIILRRLGTTASLSENGLQNHYWFCRPFFQKSFEVPNRYFKPLKTWVPKLLNVACVPNGPKDVDSILRKQGCYAQPGHTKAGVSHRGPFHLWGQMTHLPPKRPHRGSFHL